MKQAYRADVAFDGEQAIPSGALVLVRDGVIVGVEPGSAPSPAEYTVSYRPGTTLLPGLIDTHTHLCGNNQLDALDRLPGLTAAELDETIVAAMARQLARGITAVRDLGDQAWAVVDRHRKAPDGPTVVASGPPITSPGGHCAQMGGEAIGVEALRRAVRERAERGADLVKIMTSGGMMTQHTDIRACQYTVEELRAVVDEAHHLGLPVAAHAHAATAVRQCVDAGVDTIEHCSCFGENGMRTPPGLAEAIAAAGIVVCPTLGHDVSSLDEQSRAMMEKVGFSVEKGLAQVGELYRGGVTLISGADSGINPLKPHGVMPEALSQLSQAGVPVATVLASATGLAAQAIGLGDRTGRLRPGLDADLLIVDGDATTDVSTVHDVRTVICRGQLITSAE
jgi:imidazolonepropionase-like amidohydrolase